MATICHFFVTLKSFEEICTNSITMEKFCVQLIFIFKNLLFYFKKRSIYCLQGLFYHKMNKSGTVLGRIGNNFSISNQAEGTHFIYSFKTYLQKTVDHNPLKNIVTSQTRKWTMENLSLISSVWTYQSKWMVQDTFPLSKVFLNLH